MTESVLVLDLDLDRVLLGLEVERGLLSPERFDLLQLLGGREMLTRLRAV